MNAAFFGLAFTAALNPKLLGADLLIREPPGAGDVHLLPGGLGMSIRIGIVDVLFVQADAVKTQRSVSASVDLALGLCLLVFGALAGTPGASDILGLKQLVQSNDPAGLQVVGVLLFCLIQFSPMIIPFLCLELWPEGTKTRLRALNALRGRASILAVRSM